MAGHGTAQNEREREREFAEALVSMGVCFFFPPFGAELGRCVQRPEEPQRDCRPKGADFGGRAARVQDLVDALVALCVLQPRVWKVDAVGHISHGRTIPSYDPGIHHWQKCVQTCMCIRPPLIFSPLASQAQQTNCPHLLRYLATVVITHPKRKSLMGELVRAVEQCTHVYQDPILDFLLSLYSKFDFEKAQQKLRECEVGRGKRPCRF